MKQCPNCKSEVADNDKFCSNCGASFSIPNKGEGYIPPSPFMATSLCTRCGVLFPNNVFNPSAVCPSCNAILNPKAPVKKRSLVGCIIAFICAAAAFAGTFFPLFTTTIYGKYDENFYPWRSRYILDALLLTMLLMLVAGSVLFLKRLGGILTMVFGLCGLAVPLYEYFSERNTFKKIFYPIWMTTLRFTPGPGFYIIVLSFIGIIFAGAFVFLDFYYSKK
ncbi:MAG: zinc ribbon domain-containing protein [Lachnospiraceae bacterium]|nr:zinc ribbon domain-containing protein [Lachnospiraceae bacterium]